MNKFERVKAGHKKIIQRAKKLRWQHHLNVEQLTVENLPAKTRIALSTTGNIARGKRDDKKRFGKSTGKKYYGHFSGGCQKHLGAKDLRERVYEKE